MLKNLSLRYDAEEDRLLLLLTLLTDEGQERAHALYLTRRLCAAWRQDLQQMVDLSAQVPERLQPALRAAVSKAHHDAQASQARARTEPAPEFASLSGVPTPMLVSRIRCGRSKGSDAWVIQFDCKGGASLGLRVGSQTLHALVDALSRRVQAAQWGLPTLPVERDAPKAEVAAGPHLH